MHVDEEEKLNDKTSSSLEPRGGWLNNESGLYADSGRTRDITDEKNDIAAINDYAEFFKDYKSLRPPPKNGIRLRNNERLPAPDLPSGTLESWAYCVVFSFSLPLPASCLRNDQSNKKVKSTRISRAESYLKPLLG